MQYCVRGERWRRPCDRLRPTSKECSHLSEQEACRPVVPPWPRRTRGPSSHRRDAGRRALCALVDGRPPFTPCISSRHAVGVLPFREARPRAVVQESGRVAPHHPLAKVPPSTHPPVSGGGRRDVSAPDDPRGAVHAPDAVGLPTCFRGEDVTRSTIHSAVRRLCGCERHAVSGTYVTRVAPPGTSIGRTRGLTAYDLSSPQTNGRRAPLRAILLPAQGSTPPSKLF